MAFSNHYHTLGISTQASARQIKLAFRALAKRWHPDRNDGSLRAEEKFKIIQAAYEILSNPARKRRYDFRYREELKKAPEPPQKEPFAWKSADNYENQLNNLWKQYETISRDQHKKSQTGPKQAGQKYYYYNQQKMTEQEFRNRTRAQEPSPKTETKKKKKKKRPSFEKETFHMNTEVWQDYMQKSLVDRVVWILGVVFVLSLGIVYMGSSFFIPGISIALSLMLLIFFLLQPNQKLAHQVIELHPNYLIERGKGLVAQVIFFEHIRKINAGKSGIWIWQHIENPDQDSDLPRASYIFIPSVIPGFDKLKSFLYKLENS